MSFGQIIKGTILPKVPLKTLYEEDTSADGNSTATYKSPKKYQDSSQKIGGDSPYIKIGGQIVKEVQMMTIDETGFIPTVTLVFNDTLGEFAGDYFPKTNVIMNLYIKVGSDKLKPIRCDFLITSMKSMPMRYTGKREGLSKDLTYTVKGELYIPGIYTNISKSYSKLTSKDALKQICTNLGLGFAENESAPNDKMTWVNTNMSTLSFMQNIIRHAYQNDDSFFMGFIDKYYYLNYIEVNRQLKVEEASNTFVTAANPLTKGINQFVKDDAETKKLEETLVTNYLTTELQFKGGANYITALNLISDQGALLKTHGYKKNIYYYDHLKSTQRPAEKFKDFYVTPLKSLDRSQDQFLVPEEISLAENKIKKWMDIDYGNAHPEWNASRLINAHNLKELDKIKLRVSLNAINFQAIRGFVIPVFVTIQRAEEILKATETADTTAPDRQKKNSPDRLTDQVIDEQLSGYYYVSGAKYHYDVNHPGGFYTELFMARREWKKSKITD